MNQNDDIISADGLFQVVFVEREDGTHGYSQFKNTNDAARPVWLLDAMSCSRFASREIAIREAQARVAWLNKEAAWPARERDPVALSEDVPGWMRCPFCRLRFCLQDAARWGGSRHLTCGQRIVHTAAIAD